MLHENRSVDSSPWSLSLLNPSSPFARTTARRRRCCRHASSSARLSPRHPHPSPSSNSTSFLPRIMSDWDSPNVVCVCFSCPLSSCFDHRVAKLTSSPRPLFRSFAFHAPSLPTSGQPTFAHLQHRLQGSSPNGRQDRGRSQRRPPLGRTDRDDRQGRQQQGLAGCVPLSSSLERGQYEGASSFRPARSSGCSLPPAAGSPYCADQSLFVSLGPDHQKIAALDRDDEAKPPPTVSPSYVLISCRVVYPLVVSQHRRADA
jgi:hypothetical protein